MKLYCHPVDTCLPDYWSGHHKAHVQIPVYRGMTINAVKNAIISELHEGAIAGSDVIADKLRDYDDAVFNAAIAAVKRDVKHAQKGRRKLFMDLPEYDENDESVCSFFVFSED